MTDDWRFFPQSSTAGKFERGFRRLQLIPEFSSPKTLVCSALVALVRRLFVNIANRVRAGTFDDGDNWNGRPRSPLYFSLFHHSNVGGR